MAQFLPTGRQDAEKHSQCLEEIANSLKESSLELLGKLLQ